MCDAELGIKKSTIGHHIEMDLDLQEFCLMSISEKIDDEKLCRNKGGAHTERFRQINVIVVKVTIK